MRTKRLRGLIPDGYEPVLQRRGHVAIRNAATGELLRLVDGRPLHLSATPSDHRADRNARMAIRRALELARLDGQAAAFRGEVRP